VEGDVGAEAAKNNNRKCYELIPKQRIERNEFSAPTSPPPRPSDQGWHNKPSLSVNDKESLRTIAVRARAECSGWPAVNDDDCDWKLPSAYCLSI
jgi:hypothetical protein